MRLGAAANVIGAVVLLGSDLRSFGYETSEDDRFEVGGAVKVDRDRRRSRLAPGSFEGFCIWLLG
jgi:hypothetical protein